MHSWSNNKSPVLFRVKVIKEYDHPTCKKVWEGNIFDVYKETDSHYEIEVQLELTDTWGVPIVSFATELYPKEVFVKYDPSVNPHCTCGAAKLGYNKPGRAHSHFMKCVLYKDE